MQLVSVSSLNTQIKSLLEATFMHVSVEGEVSQCTYHTSGHLYFTLKDNQSTLRCVMWRSNASKLKFRLEKGMHIIVHGSVSVYVPRGEYQLQSLQIEPYGQGALSLAFEQLKNKLQQKGYFDPSIKKKLPKFVNHIALVTAKESAALADMLRIAQSRWPLVHITIIDTPVQGEDAANAIAQALYFADKLRADVVVVGRGGGSKEDLWAFNEEVVADAIFAMQTPVVSAVGHEIDTLISDMVADVRAPTPSAAMEIILPDQNEELRQLSEILDRLTQGIYTRLHQHQMTTTHLKKRLQSLSPIMRLQHTGKHLKELADRYELSIHRYLNLHTQRVREYQDKLKHSMATLLVQKERNLQHTFAHLKHTNPSLRYKKGWAQISLQGKVVALKDLQINDCITLHDTATRIEALVTHTEATHPPESSP